MKPKQLVLLIPAVFLALSVDRLSPDRFRPRLFSVSGPSQALPMLPAVNEGRLGRPGEPLNVLFVATPQDLAATLKEAGWTAAPTSLRGSVAAGLGELLDGRAPVSFPPPPDYRLLGRRQNMNWTTASGPRAPRRRFSLWMTGMVDGEGRGLWWGSASGEREPAVDAERDFVVKTLTGSARVETIALLRLPQIPVEGVDDRDRPYRGDGRAAVIALKRNPRPEE